MQNFTPIGVTVAEISVTVQKLTSTLILDKTHTNVAFVDNIAGALFHGYF